MDVPAVLQALIDGGWTQKQLAEQLGTEQSAVSNWLRGKREPRGRNMEAIRQLAEREGIIERRSARIVPVMGRIGGGAEIEPSFEQVPPEGIEQVELPFPLEGDMIGFQVIGDSMAPAYEENAIIIVERQQSLPTSRLVGLNCAVTILSAVSTRTTASPMWPTNSASPK